MASKYLQKYPVPEDFPDLLHDFAREVLRDQPENIYEYGAQYFKSLYMVSFKFKRLVAWFEFVTYFTHSRECHSIMEIREETFHHQRIGCPI